MSKAENGPSVETSWQQYIRHLIEQGQEDMATQLEHTVERLFRFCDRFGLPKPSTHQILVTLFLVEDGLVRYDRQNEKSPSGDAEGASKPSSG